MKQCKTCKEVKPIKDFYAINIRYSKDGLYRRCKDCERKRQKIWKMNNLERSREPRRKYAKNNAEKERARQKKYIKNNIEKVREWRRKYYENNKNKMKKYGEIWQKSNEEKVKIIRNRHYYNHRVSHRMANYIGLSIKGKKNNIHWEELVNFTLQELVTHLEKQFKPGMSWNNYGFYGWHIDHVIPVSLWRFENFTDREFKQCWALCNLQPLWAKENQRKGNKVA